MSTCVDEVSAFPSFNASVKIFGPVSSVNIRSVSKLNKQHSSDKIIALKSFRRSKFFT